MAYEKKTWVDRQSEYPGRRKLTATATADVYDVTREEGLIVEEGDALDAQNLNNLESRIEAGLEEKAEAAHTHEPGDLTGVVPESKGGTGQSSLGNVTVGSASKLATARTIGLSGGATGTATAFDGSANITIPVTALKPANMSAGTLPAGVKATNSTDYATPRLRNIRANTGDMTPGSPALNNGEIYLVYE